MRAVREWLQVAFLSAVAAHACAAEWTEDFARAETFLPPQISERLPSDVSADALLLKWAPDESSLDWTAPDGRRRRVQLPSGKVTFVAATVASEASDPKAYITSEDGRFRVFAKDHNLYVADAKGTRALTDDGELWRSFDARYADSNPQSRVIRPVAPPLVKFLGDSSWLVAERWDFRKVAPVWLSDSTATPRPALIEQRRALPGDREIAHPELWLIDAASGARRPIDNEGWAYVGNMDVGAGGIFPAPDGRSLYFVRMQRQYQIVELCRVTVPDGAVEVVWREQRDGYFTVRAPEVAFVTSERLIWKSDRDGRVHYYLLDVRKKSLVRQLSFGELAASRVLHVDPAKGEFFFEAFGDAVGGDPNYVHAFRAGLNGAGQRRLDSEAASHSFTPSPSARYFVDTYSTVEQAPRTVIRDRVGRAIAELATSDVGQLRAVGWRPPERYRIKAADAKTDLYGVLWKPFDFDPRRRYPVVAVVYPGPASDKVPTRFVPAHVNSALAQLGFIVISPGTRGSASWRGVEYQSHARTSGNIRDYPLEDLRHTIESLAGSRPWMDVARVGVMGHSGGGFMSLAAMLHDPDFYRVGVAAAGNHDNNIYEMNSSEFYWGDPHHGPAGGPQGYATNLERMQRLQGALLLIHGETDSDVPLANTLRVVDALVHANKLFDLLILPGQDHAIRYSDASANAYVRRRTWRYLTEHLLTSR